MVESCLLPCGNATEPRDGLGHARQRVAASANPPQTGPSATKEAGRTPQGDVHDS